MASEQKRRQRCHAPTKTGKRCRHFAKGYSDYCATHTTASVGVHVWQVDTEPSGIYPELEGLYQTLMKHEPDMHAVRGLQKREIPAALSWLAKRSNTKACVLTCKLHSVPNRKFKPDSSVGHALQNKCKGVDWTIIDISMMLGVPHNNILIIRGDAVYHFDPNGKEWLQDYDTYNADVSQLEEYFGNLGFSYRAVTQTCPAWGPQAVCEDDGSLFPDDYEGMCSAWSLLIAHVWMLAPDLSPTAVSVVLLRGMRLNPPNATPCELNILIRRWHAFLRKNIPKNGDLKATRRGAPRWYRDNDLDYILCHEVID